MNGPAVAGSATKLFPPSPQARPSRAIGACNALAASVAADAGFDALWISGLEVATARGLPDTNVLNVRDLVDVVQVVTDVSGLPAIVDIDNAGGSVDQAHRYGYELARAGATAVSLEDSAYPKCNSFDTYARQGLADPNLLVGQLHAIRAASREKLVVIARTEALISGSDVTSAVQRATRYAAAGADAVIIHSKDRTGEEAVRLAEHWQDSATPLVCIPTAFPHLSDERLGALGYRLVIFANQLSRLALAAMRLGVSEYLDTGHFGRDYPMTSVQDLLRIGSSDATADF